MWFTIFVYSFGIFKLFDYKTLAAKLWSEIYIV